LYCAIATPTVVGFELEQHAGNRSLRALHSAVPRTPSFSFSVWFAVDVIVDVLFLLEFCRVFITAIERPDGRLTISWREITLTVLKTKRMQVSHAPRTFAQDGIPRGVVSHAAWHGGSA
jgi:hypothetical protein